MSEPERVGPFAVFGKWIREQRETKFKSQPAAVLRAQQKHLRLINQGKLSHLERGMNGNPEPELLAQLATLYEIDYSRVVAKWITTRYGEAVSNDDVSDLLRPTRTGQSDSHHPGESDDPASDRIAELERRLAEYQRILDSVIDAGHVLARALAAGEKVSQAAGIEPKARKHHRRAG